MSSTPVALRSWRSATGVLGLPSVRQEWPLQATLLEVEAASFPDVFEMVRQCDRLTVFDDQRLKTPSLIKPCITRSNNAAAAWVKR